MASNPRYQVLTNDDDEPEDTIIIVETNNENTNTIDNPSLPNELPPPYEPGEASTGIITAEDYTESPPLYSDVVKLPTYNESENIESDSEENTPANRSILLYLMSSDHAQQDLSDETVGTDVGFIICFLLSFIFNGLGFIVAYCSTSTLSSHYGAISGFGLSLVKWAFIAKHSAMSKDYFQGNEWLLYVLILLGWMIFLRGMFAYAQLKRFVFSRWGANRPQEIIE